VTFPNYAMPAAHVFSREDLRALVTSREQGPALERVQSAQFSKHKLLLTTVMRMAADARPAMYRRTLTDAYALLAQAESRDREVVRNLIASPQFGAWATDCAYRLRIEESGHRVGPPLWTDLGQLAAVAAAAAFRTGEAFEIEVPLRRGMVVFPTLGAARPGARVPWEWGRISQDARGRSVRSSVSTVRIPAAGEPCTVAGAWSVFPRLVADADGLRLEVTLDSHDPFLDRFGSTRSAVTRHVAVRWQRLLSTTWPVLTGQNYLLAEMIAATVRTVVPLEAPSPTRSASSTETSSFGAVAMSLPPDALAMAETLVHESHHAVLGAVMDIVPMFASRGDALMYAPWREDARPESALLQGIYTHYGVTRFWRRQRRAGSAAQRLRGHVEFGRWRTLTAQTAHRLAGSGTLTEHGSFFLSAIQRKLAEWQAESLPDEAREYIADLSLDHRVRWRLRHMVPDPAAMDALAGRWRRGDNPAPAATRIDVTLEPGSLPGPTDNAREYLIARRYRDPEGNESAYDLADSADTALAARRYALAARRYRTRIQRGDDRDAWAGLAVARRHTGPRRAARLLATRPEVVAALYRRVRGSDQASPDAVVAWLADAS
jgi:HEXXH motif-containing protein